MEVSLDSATLELETKPAPSIRFYPNHNDADEYYALKKGTLEIESVTRVDADSQGTTMRISH